MKTIRQSLLLLLAACLLLSTLVACKSAEEKLEQTVIGTAAGFEVLYEELRYATLSKKDEMELVYGEGIWDDPTTAEQYRAELESRVWSVMLNNYAVLATCRDYMPRESINSKTIDEEVDKELEAAIEEYGGKSAFRAAMKEMYMTESFVRFNARVMKLQNELYYVLTEDLLLIENDATAFTDWLENGNCVYLQHVKIENDPGEDPAANRALAEQVRAQLISGEKTIDQLVGSSINEDLRNVAPYYCVRDVYKENFEAAAFALNAPGDVSEVIEAEDGYYVLVRMEESDERTFLSQVPALLNEYQKARMESLFEEKKQTLKIELNEFGKSIDLLTIE